MPTTASTHCDSCQHDWHGLSCHHEAVERDGWFLVRRRCTCPGPGRD